MNTPETKSAGAANPAPHSFVDGEARRIEVKTVNGHIRLQFSDNSASKIWLETLQAEALLDSLERTITHANIMLATDPIPVADSHTRNTFHGPEFEANAIFTTIIPAKYGTIFTVYFSVVEVARRNQVILVVGINTLRSLALQLREALGLVANVVVR